MARLQKVSHRGGRGQLIAHQGGQRRVRSQGLQILAALAPRHPQRNQRLHQLGRRQPTLPPFDPNLLIDDLRRTHAAKQLDHQRHARMRGDDEGRINLVIDVERQSDVCRRRLRYQTPP